MRVGLGHDVHRLVPGRRLVLGGVTVPYGKGLAGHSDGDALLHAVCDALLGAAGLGDIGEHFPDSDPSLAGIDSALILKRVLELVQGSGWRVENVDCTIHAEAPKLLGLKEKIRSNIATLLGISTERVNCKAKTAEGLGAVGRGEAIAADAVVLLSARGRKESS